jgi:hypothetical protein
MTLVALPLIFQNFHQQGKGPSNAVADEIMETVKIYNPIDPILEADVETVVLDAYVHYLRQIDRTDIFTRLHFKPVIRISSGDEKPEVVRARTLRALQTAQKYSLVASSVKSEIIIEPQIEIII